MRSKSISVFLLFFALLLLFSSNVNAQTPNPPTSVPTLLPSPTPTPSLDEKVSNLESEIQKINEKIDNPPKDIWDKINSVSGLVSGILIAIIGGIATYVYRERDRSTEEARKSRELSILQVQTIQSFMPQLQSGDEKAVEAALLAITALGNSKIATELATLYSTEGAVSALSKISSSPDPVVAQQAEQSLETVFAKWNSAIVIVEGNSKCTGFIFRPDGYIITTDVILKDADTINVFWKDKTYKAKIVAQHHQENLAILKIDNGIFPTLTLKLPKDAIYPEEVFVLGPDPTMGWVVSGGMTVGLETEKDNPERVYIRARIGTKPGYAGAPVINGKGEVVGLALVKDQQGSLLIPAASIEKLISETNFDDNKNVVYRLTAVSRDKHTETEN